jgi:transposase
VAEVTARTVAELVGVNRYTATLYYQKIRKRIVLKALKKNLTYLTMKLSSINPILVVCVKGKEVEEQLEKYLFFGLLKRGGKVYTQVVTNTKTETTLANHLPENQA